MVSLVHKARAYINWGVWKADCPARCNSACQLEPKQTMFCCDECRHIAPIDWPEDADELWAALDTRPKQNRNWFPSDHELALASGAPHGQTPQDLRDETREHEVH